MKKRNFKIKAIEKALHLVLATIFILSLSTLVSCSSDEEEVNKEGEANLSIMLTIQTRASSSSEYGQWENHIDINSHNFRIYFFTADKDDEKATSDSEKNTLITTLYATDITQSSLDDSQYTVVGNVTDVMTAYKDFKVVVLANWGSYPSVTAGVTTIDDLVEGNNTTFNASYYLSGINTSHYIPFFGVNEYEDVNWTTGTTVASTTINMLSALAKVEVTFDENYISRFGSVENVEIVRYNSKGFSAPKDVYNNDDYVGTDGYPLLSSLHLVGGANDEDEADGPKTYSFVKEETDDNTDSWVIYLPEYSNMSTDYSYIRVTLASDTSETDEHIIYFGQYDEGVCTAYDTEGNLDDRFNIYRNYYYSFTVSHTATIETYYIELITPTWSNHFQNDSSTDLVKHD